MTIAVLGTPPVHHHRVPCHHSSPRHPLPLCQPTLAVTHPQTTSVGHFLCDWASEQLLAVMSHSMRWSTYRDSSEFHSIATLGPPCTHAPAAVLVVFDVHVNIGGGGGGGSGGGGGRGGGGDHHCCDNCHCTAALAAITHVHSPCQVASCLSLPLKVPWYCFYC